MKVKLSLTCRLVGFDEMLLSILDQNPFQQSALPFNDRDEKVKVLRACRPVLLDEVVLGQYIAGAGQDGYLDDKASKPLITSALPRQQWPRRRNHVGALYASPGRHGGYS